MKPRANPILPAVLSSFLLTMFPLQAADIAWDGDTSTAWATGANWTGGTAAANDLTTDIAVFNLAGPYGGSTPRTPNIVGTQNVSGIQFGAINANMSITGSSTPVLFLGANGISKASGSGTVYFNPSPSSGQVRLGAAQSWVNDSAAVINIGWPTLLDSYDLTVAGTGNFTFSASTTLSSNLEVSSAGTVLFSGSLNGNGNILKSGGGTLSLTNPNGFVTTGAAGIDIAAGTLSFTTDDRLGNTANDITLRDGGILESTYSGFFTLNAGRVITVGSSGGGINMSNASGSMAMGSNLTGFGDLTKTGAGRLSITGASFSGNAIVSQGIFTVGTSGSLSTQMTGYVDAASGAIVEYRGSGSAGAISVGGLRGLGTVRALSTSRTLDINTATGSSHTLLGNITDSGAVVTTINKAGLGTQILSGANTYTGTTTVTAGTLQFGTQTALYNNVGANWTAAKIIVQNSGTLALNVGGAGEFTTADVTSLAALGTGSGGFRNGSILGLDTSNAGGTFTYNTALANPNAGANVLGLTKLGTGTLALGGVNTFTGTTRVAAGTLNLSGGSHASTDYEVSGGSFNQTNGTGWSTDIFHIDGYTSGATVQVADLADSASGTSELQFTMGVNGVNTLVLTEADPFAQHYAGSAAAWAGEWSIRLDTDGSIAPEDYMNYSLIDSANLLGLNGLLTIHARNSEGTLTTFVGQGNNSLVYIQSGSELAEYKISLTASGLDLIFQSSRSIPEPGTLGLLVLAGALLHRRLRPFTRA